MKQKRSLIAPLARKLNSWFKSVKYGDTYTVDDDIRRISLSSTLLQISEFRFFQLAYRQWYGRDMYERGMESIFDDYMFGDIVPHYVRHLSRKVVNLFDQGKLDPIMFDLDRPKPSPKLRSVGIAYTVMLSILLVLFCILISDYLPFD